jgi:hypothetical protein
MTPPFLNFLVLKGEFTMAHSSRSNCELFCTPAPLALDNLKIELILEYNKFSKIIMAAKFILKGEKYGCLR